MASQRLVFLLRRRPHLTREQFQQYWWDSHRPLVAARAEVLGIRRYQQVHARQELDDTGLTPFDGVAELWLDGPAPTGTREEIAAAGRELLDDERTFIDLAHSPIFVGAEHLLHEGPQEGLRMTGVVGIKPGVSREAFQDYWINGHGRAVRDRLDVYGISHYVQVHAPVDADAHALAVNRGAPPAPVGIAEAWLTAPTAPADEADRVRAAGRERDLPYFDYARTQRFLGEVRLVLDRM